VLDVGGTVSLNHGLSILSGSIAQYQDD